MSVRLRSQPDSFPVREPLLINSMRMVKYGARNKNRRCKKNGKALEMSNKPEFKGPRDKRGLCKCFKAAAGARLWTQTSLEVSKTKWQKEAFLSVYDQYQELLTKSADSRTTEVGRYGREFSNAFEVENGEISGEVVGNARYCSEKQGTRTSSGSDSEPSPVVFRVLDDTILFKPPKRYGRVPEFVNNVDKEYFEEVLTASFLSLDIKFCKYQAVSTGLGPINPHRSSWIRIRAKWNMFSCLMMVWLLCLACILNGLFMNREWKMLEEAEEYFNSALHMDYIAKETWEPESCLL